MIKVNIAEAKARLSKYLQKVEQGETVVVCRRNEPIAEIRPLKPAHRERNPIGLAEGEFTVPPEFFEPMPKEFMKYFTGEDE